MLAYKICSYQLAFLHLPNKAMDREAHPIGEGRVYEATPLLSDPTSSYVGPTYRTSLCLARHR